MCQSEPGCYCHRFAVFVLDDERAEFHGLHVSPVEVDCGIGLLGHAAARELGVSMLASTGDRADVSTNDLLECFEDDERTAAVMLHVETFGNPEHQPLPRGRRIGIVTNSTGVGTLATDACAARGLEVAAHVTSPNPVRLGINAGPEQYATSIRELLSDPGIDAVMVFYVDLFDDPELVLAAISTASTAQPTSRSWHP